MIMNTLRNYSLMIALLLAIAIMPASAKWNSKKAMITVTEVEAAQKAWGEGIVSIGQKYAAGDDYTQAARNHINRFYNYADGNVLFKPTLTSEVQFRNDKEGALSYFVGGNDNYTEDKGFAIKGWKNVRWESAGITIQNGVALAMGNYYFTPADESTEVKVEYSFVYVKDRNGNLKIVLHDSHKPYNPGN